MVQDTSSPLTVGKQSELYNEALRYEPNPGTGLSHLQLGDGRALPFDMVPRGTAGLFLALGAAETPTIASGVLTVTRPFVNPQPESTTADTVTSIVYAGAEEGDLLLIHVPATNTITFDDASINLAAATRAVAPGGSLLLVYDGSEWSEVVFLAATDNA